MAERSTGTALAEVLIPVAAGAVILGSVATLVWLASRKSSALSGAPARNVTVDPHFGSGKPRRITPQAFTDGDDQGYDLDVDGEDVT